MRAITSLILMAVSVSMLAQAKLALTTNFGYKDTYIYKNSALISKILLTQYGDKWYEENLLSNRSDISKIRLYMVIDMCGYFTIRKTGSRMSEEVKDAILKVLNIIEQEHIVVYGNWAYYDLFIKNHKSVMSQDMPDIILQEKAFGIEWFEIFPNNWFFLFPPNTSLNYKFYADESLASGIEPLSYLDWLKQKIEYYMALPIESSLDYGITNEDFCPQQNN